MGLFEMAEMKIDEMTELTNLRYLFPKNLEEKIISLCRDNEAQRLAVQDLHQRLTMHHKDQSYKIRNQADSLNSVLMTFYLSGGYWGLMADARKEARTGKERGPMIFETPEGRHVDCLRKHILVKDGSAYKRRNLDESYEAENSGSWHIHTLNRVRIAYDVLYCVDPERFSMLEGIGLKLREYDKAMMDIDQQGGMQIQNKFSTQTEDSKCYLSGESFQVITYGKHAEHQIAMKGELNNIYGNGYRTKTSAVEYVVKFNRKDPKNRYSISITSMYLPDTGHDNMQYLKHGYHKVLEKEILKFENVYLEAQNHNTDLLDDFNEVLAKENALSLELKQTIVSLYESNKNVIDRYMLSKDIDKVI